MGFHGKLRPSADLGLGLGDPRVTLGSPKRHARATHGPRKRRFRVKALFAIEIEKRPGGGARKAHLSPTSRVIAVIGKAKHYHLIRMTRIGRDRVILVIGGISPGLNPLSAYFSGLRQGRGGIALNQVKCPVESARTAPVSKDLCAALKAFQNKKYLPWPLL